MARVLLPLAPGFEELEAITLVDVLRRAQVEVTLASLADDLSPVRSVRQVAVVPDTTLAACLDQKFDAVVLPGGGPGSQALAADLRLRHLLQQQVAAGRWVAAICAAPMVLQRAGLLHGRQVTCYPGVLETLPTPEFKWLQQAVVDDGAIVTSRGPGTALDLALHLVRRLCGASVATQIAQDLLWQGPQA